MSIFRLGDNECLAWWYMINYGLCDVGFVWNISKRMWYSRYTNKKTQIICTIPRYPVNVWIGRHGVQKHEVSSYGAYKYWVRTLHPKLFALECLHPLLTSELRFVLLFPWFLPPSADQGVCVRLGIHLRVACRSILSYATRWCARTFVHTVAWNKLWTAEKDFVV